MDSHTPKSMHSLRDFAKEVGTIILSILILASSAQGRTGLDTLIGYAQDRLARVPHATPNGFNISGNFAAVNTAAWESTVGTQALVHLSHPQAQAQAQAVSRACSASRTFNELEGRLEQQWFELSALPQHPDQISDVEIASALGHLRVVSTYR